MTFVFGPASFLIAALVPTARELAAGNRHASAIEKTRSTVTTWPLTSTTSGAAGVCWAASARTRQ
jgi:hypothetical protein